jgi:hypothetical protein
MKADAINRWLTLGANVGVLIGIILLVAELNQNSVLMRAQIFNERAGQAIDVFMPVAESPELSNIVGIDYDLSTPDYAAAFSNLTRTQKVQYRWFVRADRYRVENLLYQQALGILEYDAGPVDLGHQIIKKYEVMIEDGQFGENPPGLRRLRRLISEVEETNPQNN